MVRREGTSLGLLGLILVGLAGVVLFFPLKINSVDTCLFQHKFSPSGAALNSTAGSDADYDTLIRRYLIPYGLLWWLSLGAATFGVVGVVRSLRAGRQRRTLTPSET